MKPWRGGTDEEYETQHFGFGAQRLKIAVRQMIEQKIMIGVRDMESSLQKSLNLNDTDKKTLTHSCDKLISLYCERSGPSLQIIDKEIEQILQIPSNVLLPDDEVQMEQMSDNEYERLKDEVANLEKKVERGALMEALLLAEEKELMSVDKVSEAAKRDIDILDLLYKNEEKADTLNSIQNETKLLCESVPFIKDNNDLFEDN